MKPLTQEERKHLAALERMAPTPAPWQLATSNSWRRIVDSKHGSVVSPTIQKHDGQPDLWGHPRDLEVLIEARNALGSALATIDVLEDALLNTPCKYWDPHSCFSVDRCDLAGHDDPCDRCVTLARLGLEE